MKRLDPAIRERRVPWGVLSVTELDPELNESRLPTLEVAAIQGVGGSNASRPSLSGRSRQWPEHFEGERRLLNLPNVITTVRLALTPIVGWLILRPTGSSRLMAFVVFLVAALSDLWDGHLARRRGQITDFGKLVDPIADKLLLVATLIPFYLLTRENPELVAIPWFGGIHLWVLVVFFGRELLITVLRALAARRGSVMAARTAGKRKAVAQNVFIGAMILWTAFRTAGLHERWGGEFAHVWAGIHGWFTTASLVVALVLTVTSMAFYLTAFQRLFRVPRQ